MHLLRFIITMLLQVESSSGMQTEIPEKIDVYLHTDIPLLGIKPKKMKALI